MEKLTNNVQWTVKKVDAVKAQNILNDLQLAYTTAYENDDVIFTLNLDEAQWRKLYARVSIDKIGTLVSNGIEYIVDGLVKTVGFVATEVAAPIVKMGAKVGAAALRIGTQATVKAGAGVINSAYNGARETADFIKNDDEIQTAATNVCGTFKAVWGAIKKVTIGSGNGTGLKKL